MLIRFFYTSSSDPVVLDSTRLYFLIYADDFSLFSEPKNGLQSCPDFLQLYGDSWKLKISIDKTKAMIFSSGKIDTKSFKFTFSDSEIEVVNRYKYLGVILHYNANFKHATEDMYQKVYRDFFPLKIKFKHFDVMNNHLKLKLFDTLTRPI